jgi:putative FmdB family regulatory protein
VLGYNAAPFFGAAESQWPKGLNIQPTRFASPGKHPMPIYEYQCESCGHELEALQKMSDAALTDCPACNTPSLKKKISAAAFRLKGGGWYETDFKSGNKKNLAGDDSKGSSESKKSESKSDSSTKSSQKSATGDSKK